MTAPPLVLELGAKVDIVVAPAVLPTAVAVMVPLPLVALGQVKTPVVVRT